MSLKGTRTQVNLMEAFSKAAQARCAYGVFADIAKVEGLDQISTVLQQTSENKQAHVKMWAKYMGGIGTTKDNLKFIADLEAEAYGISYPKYIREAREEGFAEIAEKYEKLSAILKAHETMCRTFINQLEMASVMKGSETVWKCASCGDIHYGDFAPSVCPICEMKDSYQELKKEIIRYVTSR